MTNDNGKTRFWLKEPRCPRCGCSLISDGKYVWCSFVGSGGQPACRYGLDGDVLIESAGKAAGTSNVLQCEVERRNHEGCV